MQKLEREAAPWLDAYLAQHEPGQYSTVPIKVGSTLQFVSTLGLAPALQARPPRYYLR